MLLHQMRTALTNRLHRLRSCDLVRSLCVLDDAYSHRRWCNRGANSHRSVIAYLYICSFPIIYRRKV